MLVAKVGHCTRNITVGTVVLGKDVEGIILHNKYDNKKKNLVDNVFPSVSILNHAHTFMNQNFRVQHSPGQCRPKKVTTAIKSHYPHDLESAGVMEAVVTA